VCLDRLTGLDPAPDSWEPRFSAYAAAFEPALGPQEGPPAGYSGDSPTIREPVQRDFICAEFVVQGKSRTELYEDLPMDAFSSD
jgi:hypothetical protein